MTDAELFSNWYLYLIVGGVIVIAAAALLIGIWLAARRVLRLALVALSVVESIKGNTQCIWGLRETAELANAALTQAESIRDHGAMVATALSEEEESHVA